MKVKIAEATNLQLDWMVGTIEKAYRMRVARPLDWSDPSDNRWIVRAQVENVGWFADYPYQPTVNPLQAWPIIDREGIGFYKANATKWWAHPYGGEYNSEGSTALVAAMRCYCASRLGEEAEVPEELL